MTMMMPKMREAKWAQRKKRWMDPIHLFIEAFNEGNCHLHDQEIREEYRREDELPCVAKQACVCLAYKISDGLERKKET